MKTFLLSSLSVCAALFVTGCETGDDDDDVRQVSTTTTTEERLVQPAASTTTETRTIRSY